MVCYYNMDIIPTSVTNGQRLCAKSWLILLSYTASGKKTHVLVSASSAQRKEGWNREIALMYELDLVCMQVSYLIWGPSWYHIMPIARVWVVTRYGSSRSNLSTAVQKETWSLLDRYLYTTFNITCRGRTKRLTISTNFSPLL
jgi:hypothetical protein